MKKNDWVRTAEKRREEIRDCLSATSPRRRYAACAILKWIGDQDATPRPLKLPDALVKTWFSIYSPSYGRWLRDERLLILNGRDHLELLNIGDDRTKAARWVIREAGACYSFNQLSNRVETLGLSDSTLRRIVCNFRKDGVGLYDKPTDRENARAIAKLKKRPARWGQPSRKWFQQFSLQEIAAIFGKPKSTIQGWLGGIDHRNTRPGPAKGSCRDQPSSRDPEDTSISREAHGFEELRGAKGAKYLHQASSDSDSPDWRDEALIFSIGSELSQPVCDLSFFGLDDGSPQTFETTCRALGRLLPLTKSGFPNARISRTSMDEISRLLRKSRAFESKILETTDKTNYSTTPAGWETEELMVASYCDLPENLAKWLADAEIAARRRFKRYPLHALRCSNIRPRPQEEIANAVQQAFASGGHMTAHQLVRGVFPNYKCSDTWGIKTIQSILDWEEIFAAPVRTLLYFLRFVGHVDEVLYEGAILPDPQKLSALEMLFAPKLSDADSLASTTRTLLLWTDYEKQSECWWNCLREGYQQVWGVTNVGDGN